METIRAVIIGLCSGGALVAVINLIGNKFDFKRKRKAELEDRKESKEDKIDKIEQMLQQMKESSDKKDEEMDKRIDAMEKKLDALTEGTKEMLLDRVLYLGEEFIKDGEISIENKSRLRRMHKAYHYGLNGNGDADVTMEAVNDLPLAK